MEQERDALRGQVKQLREAAQAVVSNLEDDHAAGEVHSYPLGNWHQYLSLVAALDATEPDAEDSDGR